MGVPCGPILWAERGRRRTSALPCPAAVGGRVPFIWSGGERGGVRRSGIAAEREAGGLGAVEGGDGGLGVSQES